MKPKQDVKHFARLPALPEMKSVAFVASAAPSSGTSAGLVVLIGNDDSGVIGTAW